MVLGNRRKKSALDYGENWFSYICLGHWSVVDGPISSEGGGQRKKGRKKDFRPGLWGYSPALNFQRVYPEQRPRRYR
jgi:hypothetical protein